MTSLNVPSFIGVNFTSHVGPGVVSLPTSWLSLSWTNRCTSVCLSPLVVTVASLPAMNGSRTATSLFSLISNTILLDEVLVASVGLSSCSMAFTFSVTLFGSGPSFLTRSLNVPSFIGVNFTSHVGPGVVSLPTSWLSLSWTNRCTSVCLSPLVVTVASLPAMNGSRTATSLFSLISNTILLDEVLVASVGLSSCSMAFTFSVTLFGSGPSFLT